MADATPIENISLNFTSEFESATSGIDKVIGKLAELQRRIDKTSVTIKIKGVENLKQAADSTNNIDEASISKLERLTDALVRLSGVNIPDSLPNRLKSITKAMNVPGIAGVEKAADAIENIEQPQEITVTDTTKQNPIDNLKDSINDLVGLSAKLKSLNAALGDTASEMKSIEMMLPEVSSVGTKIAGLIPAKTVTKPSEMLANLPTVKEQPITEQIAVKPSELFASLQTDAIQPIQALQSEVINAKQNLSALGAVAVSAKASLNKFGESAMAFSDKHIFRGFKAMGKDMVDLTKKTFGANSGFKKLLGSIKRVALYRAIRAGIKAITNGFKEGISNLYKWSDAFDKTREFANSMDRIATAVLYVKNSLGALVAPIINYVAPAIDYLADKFVGLLNNFNEFIAALTGASTFTVAKKIPTHFEDVAKGAGKAAKALKSYTLGIDELNIIEDNAGSRGGGGGTSSVTEDWFEKKAVSQTAKDIADKVRSIAEDVRGYFEYMFSEESYEDFKDFLEYFKSCEWLEPVGRWIDEHLPDWESGFEFWKDIFDGIVEDMKLLNKYTDFFDNIFKFIIKPTIGNTPIGDAVENILRIKEFFEDIKVIVGVIKPILDNIFDKIYNVISDPMFTGMLMDIFTPLKGWAYVVDGLLDGINKAIDYLNVAFKTAAGRIKKVVQLINILLTTDPKNWFNALKNFDWGEEGTNDATEYAKSMEKAMREKNPIGKVFDSIPKEASRVGRTSGQSFDSSMADGIASKSSLITSKLNSITSSATSTMKQGSLYSSAKKTGQNIVDGIISGITEKQAELIKNAQKTASDVLKAVNKKLGIKSPSREFMKTGRYIVEGLNLGITENASSTQKVLDSWAKDMTIDPKNISMPSVGDIVDEVQGYIATAGTMAVTSEDKSLDQFMEETLMPILSNIAVDTKRQADKNETITLDGRKVTSAVNRQNRTNGYSFT